MKISHLIVFSLIGTTCMADMPAPRADIIRGKAAAQQYTELAKTIQPETQDCDGTPILVVRSRQPNTTNHMECGFREKLANWRFSEYKCVSVSGRHDNINANSSRGKRIFSRMDLCNR